MKNVKKNNRKSAWGNKQESKSQGVKESNKSQNINAYKIEFWKEIGF